MSNDTSGFYKLDSDGTLLYAEMSVKAPEYVLLKENNPPPTDGWVLFQSKEEALIAFNLPLEENK